MVELAVPAKPRHRPKVAAVKVVPTMECGETRVADDFLVLMSSEAKAQPQNQTDFTNPGNIDTGSTVPTVQGRTVRHAVLERQA